MKRKYAILCAIWALFLSGVTIQYYNGVQKVYNHFNEQAEVVEVEPTFDRKALIMGVMTCHRNNCSNIMCETYVDGVGYICGECKGEFALLVDKESHTMTERTYKRKLSDFMETEKMVGGDELTTVDEFFNKYTTKH